MPDGKKEFPFINEKIKSKPLSRKEIARRLLLVILFAAVFGAVASVTFLAVKSLLVKETGSEDTDVVEFSDEEDMPSSGEEEQPVENTEPEPEPVVITESKELEPEDYQKLQNKLYEIGKQADFYIVTVTGVSSDKDWFDTPYEKKGQGSGIIITNTGAELLVVVPERVISNAEQISVTFCDDTLAAATLKEYDANTGLAVVSIPVDTLSKETLEIIQVAELGNTVGIARGSVVIAVGSPLGTNYSILTGNVTSINNEIATIDRMMHVLTTDIVASAEGSGVLLDTEGKIIGFIMQDFALDGSENTLTAVSVAQIRDVLESLSNGKPIPYLGMRLSTVTEQLAKEHEIPTGAYIISVEIDSPAMQAGLQSGDVISSINGHEITSIYDYEKILRESAPQDIISIVVERMGAESIYSELEYTATVGVLR